ncbi:RHS repeat-associated protein [Tahibacter aquaticus]|uniref:RHS repeat-associated protein n=1 Tax=Tahibacter aquaticus TaxID=520092 RepID=A0A4R6YPJ4_9GAMM|nr:RHS repeat-associated core domain-containing protein [Tahibacter aquaticus]TDR39706.1 RHS repeat-associated protein [Tahibacter aquaticus]
MSGKPAARLGDSVAGGNIMSGAATIFIGSSEGQADKPLACTPAVGGPVNPLLGVKILRSEVDVALPAPLSFQFARSYLSSDERIGVLGQGWSIPGDGFGLQLDDDATIFIDGQGRRIQFGVLQPGQERYSPSEQIWIRRGGAAAQNWDGPWAAGAAALREDPNTVFVRSSGGVMAFRRDRSGWRLGEIANRYGYCTRFGWSELDVVSTIHDSAGRCYVLVYGRFAPIVASDRGLRLLGVALAAGGDAAAQNFDPARNDVDWRVRYDYSEAGDLIAVRDRAGEIVRRFAWEAHRLVAHSLPSGPEIRYRWDAQGRVIEQAETGGLLRRFHYRADHTEVEDSLGRRERYHFRGEGGALRWTAHERADGSRLEFGYDTLGRQVRSTDALGREQFLRRDGEGRIIGESGAAAASWHADLDADGLAVSVESSDGRRRRFDRDELGRIRAATEADGALTRYEYGDARLPDRVTATVDAAGRRRQQEWTALGQLSRYVDCSGHATQWNYDAEGQLLGKTDALGQVTRYAYDRRGRHTATVLPDGTRYEFAYDAAGRRIRFGSGTSAIRHAWDELGRLVRAVDPAGRERHFDYDPAGRLIGLRNENGTCCRFAYDALDRLVRETGFDGRTQEYRYNQAGELIACDEAGASMRLERDEAGRVIACDNRAGDVSVSRETYAWDAAGQLQCAANESAEINIVHDAAGRRIHETQLHADGWRYSVVHVHDAGGLLQSSQYDLAPAVEWRSYGSGHVHGLRLGGLALDLERDPLHRESARSIWAIDADGQAGAPLLQAMREYDAQGRLARQRSLLRGSEAQDLRHVYDGHGWLSEIRSGDQVLASFACDPAGRLAESHLSGKKDNFHYDPAGNRLDLTRRLPRADEDWTATVQANSGNAAFNLLATQDGRLSEHAAAWPDNRITDFDDICDRFDAAGNLVERLCADGERLRLDYDPAHRLVHLLRTWPGGRRIEAWYAYDPLSRRIRKKVRDGAQETITRYGWDGDRLVAEETGAQRRTIVYEPHGFVPLARIEQSLADDDDGEDVAAATQMQALLAGLDGLPPELRELRQAPRIRFFQADHLGTPQRLVDVSGAVCWQATADVWRAVGSETGDTDQPIRFQGQWHDAESGLYYNRHRYYDPRLGRYISQDPSGLAGGLNPYAYVDSSPHRYLDPLGLVLLTPAEGQQVVDKAREWIGVPYYNGGGPKSSRDKADCSGSTWQIYKEAGFDYDYASSSSFPNNPRFKKVTDGIPQQGDVGWWDGHMLIYDANAATIEGAPKDANALSARNGSKPFSAVPISWWTKPKGDVTWYRYDKPEGCTECAKK